MVDLSALVGSIVREPAPVMLLDACAVLDVVRAAFPSRKSSSNIIVSAKRLANATRAAPRAAWLVATATVFYEVREHLGPTVEELRRELRRHEGEAARLDEAAQAIVPGYQPAGHLLAAQRAKLPDELRDRVNDLLGACVELDDTNADCLDRARSRSRAKLPPAHKKESRKDCEMYEHYLTLASSLQAASVTGKRVFVSSNTEDFDLEKEILVRELVARDLKWLPDVHAAAGFLRLT